MIREIQRQFWGVTSIMIERVSFLAIAALFCLFFCVHTEAAQLTVATDESTPIRPQLSAGDMESCRSELVVIMEDYALLADRMADKTTRGIANEAINRLTQLSSKDLSLLNEGCSAVPKWHALIQSALDSAMSSLSSSAPTQSRPGVGPLSSPFPGADYSQLCGSERPLPGVIYGVLLAKEAAEGVWVGLDRVCQEVVVVAGEGGNGSVVCFPADLVRLAAEAALEGVQFCLDDVNAAEINGTYLREGHIHTDLEQVDLRLARVENKVDILTTKIDTINATLVALAAAVDNLRAQNCELTRLLNTPEGRRSSAIATCSDQPGYPYAFPQKH